MVIFRDSPNEPEDLDPKQVSIVMSLDQEPSSEINHASLFKRNYIQGFDRIVEAPEDCHSSPNIRDVKRKTQRLSSMKNIYPKNSN